MSFSTEEELVGRKYGERMTLQKKLYASENEWVYLALWREQPVVIKLAKDILNISLEIKRLVAIKKAQETFPGPRLLGYDDVEKEGHSYAFYLMSYQPGIPLHEALQKEQKSGLNGMWVMLQVLYQLHKLHQCGYVFGDWKPHSLIFDIGMKRVRFVDLGGVTPRGEELKQWTTLYDRHNWQAGLRVADEAYDLFAVTLLFLESVSSVSLATVKPEERHLKTLYDIIRTNTRLSPAVRRLFIQVVRGEICSAYDYIRILIATVSEGMYVRRVRLRQFWQRRLWECCFASASVLFLSILYVVIRM